MRALWQQIERAVASDGPVFLFGERGVGVENVARAIHDMSSRRGAPFVSFDCVAIPAGHQEVELAGSEIRVARPGLFELADGGTLLLEDVAALDPATQALVERALDARSIRRLGGARDVPATARVISTSVRPLEDEVRANRFREELFVRLRAHVIAVPPLRGRVDDLPGLASHFMAKLRRDGRLAADRIDAEAMEALLRHDWPGNARELENVLHRAMLAASTREIRRSDLPSLLPSPSRLPPGAPDANGHADADPVVPLRELERREIIKALARTNGSVAMAARQLGIGRATLYRRLSELNLPLPTVAMRNASTARRSGDGERH
jgi:DNA-binding NtrC family response regulator